MAATKTSAAFSIRSRVVFLGRISLSREGLSQFLTFCFVGPTDIWVVNFPPALLLPFPSR